MLCVFQGFKRILQATTCPNLLDSNIFSNKSALSGMYYLVKLVMGFEIQFLTTNSSILQNDVQWNLDLVTDLVTQKSVTKSWVVTKSMYFMY